MTFGQFIRNKRQSMALTQSDLASHLGYNSVAMVSMLETGERYWSLDHVIKIAELFDIEAWELVREWTLSMS